MDHWYMYLSLMLLIGGFFNVSSYTKWIKPLWDHNECFSIDEWNYVFLTYITLMSKIVHRCIKHNACKIQCNIVDICLSIHKKKLMFNHVRINQIPVFEKKKSLKNLLLKKFTA